MKFLSNSIAKVSIKNALKFAIHTLRIRYVVYFAIRIRSVYITDICHMLYTFIDSPIDVDIRNWYTLIMIIMGLARRSILSNNLRHIVIRGDLSVSKLTRNRIVLLLCQCLDTLSLTRGHSSEYRNGYRVFVIEWPFNWR